MSNAWDVNIIKKIAGLDILTEGKKPSSGMSDKEKSDTVKKAKKGEDIGEKGKNFEKIAKKAATRYGSKEAGERVAGAVMWKKLAKENVEFTDEVIDFLLREWEEDAEELTPAEKALAKKAEDDLKKKGIKVKDIDPEKDIARLAKRHKQSERGKEETEEKEEADAKKIAELEARKAKAAEPKANPKAAQKQERKAKAAEAMVKKEGEATETETKRRGRVASETSGAGQAKAWLKANSSATRKEFIEYATKHLNMSAAYAGTRHSGWKKGIAEGYILRHPGAPTYLLAEDRELNRFIWVDPMNNLEPLFLVSENEANKIAKYMSEWKGQYAVVEKINVDEE